MKTTTITSEELYAIDLAILELIMQRTEYDQQKGTNNDIIDRAGDIIDAKRKTLHASTEATS